MRFANSLKTLLRSPAKTLVTFVLLVATSFAFVSRGVEYAATVRQIEAAEASYVAIGSAEMTLRAYEDTMVNKLGDDVFDLEEGGYLGRTSRAIFPLDSEVVDKVLSSEHIEKSEIRHVSGGTHPDYWSVLEQPLSDLKDYGRYYYGISEGADRSEGTFDMYNYLFIGELYLDIEPDSCNLDVYTRQAIVSYPGRVPISREEATDQQTGAVCHTIGDDFSNVEKDYLGENYSNRAFWDTLREQSQVGDYFLLSVVMQNHGMPTLFKEPLPCVDYPIINLSYIEREYGETDIETILQDPGRYGIPRYTCPRPEHLKSKVGMRVDLSYGHPIPRDGQEPVSVLDYYATVYRNLHTSEVVYTSDMALIHKVHGGNMYASSGRLLNAEDSGDVCVIGADFAELNGLSVGDSITLDLCADTMVHSGKVFGRETPFPTDRDVVSENQLTKRGLENVTKTFEIVGIWSDSDFDVEDPFTYAMNTIFVPDDCYPWAGQVEPSALPSTFSFRLKNPGDVAAMEDELGDELAALGYELSINDGGYAAAKPNLDFMKLTALIGFIGMCLALLLALILITYLFIIRKKKDYAIMRALGTTRGKSNRSLLGALLAMSVVAIVIGAILAGVVAQGSTARMAAEVAEITGEVATADSSWVLTAAFAAGTLLLVWLFARVGLARISRTPPLELLQGR